MLVWSFRHRVDRQLAPVLKNLRRHGDHVVAELLEGALVRGLPEERLREFSREYLKEVVLHLVLVEGRASCIGVLSQRVLELRDPLLDLVQRWYWLEGDVPDVPPQALEANGLALVYVPGDPPPCIEPVEGGGALEHRLSCPGDRRGEKPPDRGVGDDHLLTREPSSHDLLELLGRDLLEILLLGPCQDVLQHRSSGNEVPLDLPFPRHSILGAVVPVLLALGQFIVEEGLLLVADGPERLQESQRRDHAAVGAPRDVRSLGLTAPLTPWRLPAGLEQRVIVSLGVNPFARRTSPCTGAFEDRHLLNDLFHVDAMAAAITSDDRGHDSKGVAVAAAAWLLASCWPGVEAVHGAEGSRSRDSRAAASRDSRTAASAARPRAT